MYQLRKDGSETLVEDREQITEYGYEGIFGIERKDWEHEKVMRALQEEFEEDRAENEERLLHGDSDQYGIYQLKDDPELKQFCFEGTEALKCMGITKYNFDAIKPDNYNLVYVGGAFRTARKDTGGDTGRSLSEI